MVVCGWEIAYSVQGMCGLCKLCVCVCVCVSLCLHVYICNCMLLPLVIAAAESEEHLPPAEGAKVSFWIHPGVHQAAGEVQLLLLPLPFLPSIILSLTSQNLNLKQSKQVFLCRTVFHSKCPRRLGFGTYWLQRVKRWTCALSEHFYQPAVCEARSQLVLWLLYVLHVCCLYTCILVWCVHSSHVPNSYVTYIIAVWCHFGWLDGCFEYKCSYYE